MMAEVDVIPELKQILGAVLFAAKKPVSVPELVTLLKNTAKEEGGATEAFGALKARDVEDGLHLLRDDVARAGCGFVVSEVGGGYRLENEVGCGPWLRQYLQRGKGNRLSRPALETLAIIAYRQPCTRSEIEAVRGVAVDQIVRNLLELQLIRIAGRSDLPGRPWLFGTTQKFLEHFGLNTLGQLPGVEELRRMEAQRAQAQAPAAQAAEGDPGPSATESAPPTEEETAAAAYLAEQEARRQETGGNDEGDSGSDDAEDAEDEDEDDEDEYDEDEDDDDEEDELID